MTRYLYIAAFSEDVRVVDDAKPPKRPKSTRDLYRNPTRGQVLDSVHEKMEWSDPGHRLDEPWLLVEQPDGSWKKPSGEDLTRLHKIHPNFFKHIEPIAPEDR